MDKLDLHARLVDCVRPEARDDAVLALHAQSLADLIVAPMKPAAVLVGIVSGARPGVLLTKRAESLSSHAGQVSFPGGRIDAEDGTPEATALREAREEIGLSSAHVDVIGRLPEHITGTGYSIVPVLALLPPGLVYTPAEAEVAAVFELPLSVLLDPEAPQRTSVFYRGKAREFWVWPHPTYYIWGATAAILVHLARRLRGETL